MTTQADDPQTDVTVDPLVGSADAVTLDHAVWASLTGPHARLAKLCGQVARYRFDVSPFAGFAPHLDVPIWDDLVALVGPGGTAAFAGRRIPLPEGWATRWEGEGVQMVDTGLHAAPDAEAVPLGSADVPEMLDLVARTQPGPFLPRTIEMGSYLGIRRGGRLIAMAGERLHPPRWTEVSAVCTDAAYRGQGLATRLVRAVAAGIRDRGETPFLHAAATNTTAIRLYESIGFTVRRRLVFQQIQVPDPGEPS